MVEAAKDGNETEVERLIAAGADLNITNKHGDYCFNIGCNQKGHTEIADMLIDAGADLNIKNERW